MVSVWFAFRHIVPFLFQDQKDLIYNIINNSFTLLNGIDGFWWRSRSECTRDPRGGDGKHRLL
jgi:hypothetical protein